MSNFPPFTIFDLETTGLDPKRGHRIIEIAGLRVEDGIIDEAKSFVSFVNPERDIPWEARQVNKISESDVAGAPTIDAVLPQFLEFTKGTILIAHNASFDYGFLSSEKEFCWGYIELPEVLCSMRLSQNLYPKEFRHNLDVLCRRFNLQMPAERHRALADCVLTAQAVLKMIEEGPVKSLDDMRKRAAIKALVA
ncbi:MAG: polymerase subunit epsilon [Candidatus Peribacteria bacterium]|nr:polymerase subunit epsilon [Candidatus Peribacteria bacterium]